MAWFGKVKRIYGSDIWKKFSTKIAWSFRKKLNVFNDDNEADAAATDELAFYHYVGICDKQEGHLDYKQREISFI